jgi:hypothetical protein
MPDDKGITKLLELDTHEVSLVESGANLKRRFPVMKALGGEEMHAVLIDILKAEGETEAMSKLDEMLNKELPEDAKAAVMGAMKLLESFSDVLGVKDALQALASASGSELVEKPEHYDKEDEAEKAEHEEADKAEHEDAEKSDEEAIAKSLESLPEAARGNIEQLFKSHRELVAKAAKLEADLGKAEAEKQRTAYITKAKETLKAIPGHDAEAMTDIILKAKALDEGFGEQVEKAFEACSSALSNSVLAEVGSDVAEVNSDPFSKIERIAKGLMAEDPNLSKPQAITKALVMNKDLANQL